MEVPIPAEILTGSGEVVLEVFAENTRSKNGFKPAEFDVFCSLDFQHVDEQAAARKFQELLKKEDPDVESYTVWEQFACKLKLRNIQVRGWDVLSIFLNITHVNSTANPENSKNEETSPNPDVFWNKGHGRRLSGMTIQEQIRAALRKAQQNPLKHTLYHSEEKKQEPYASTLVSTHDLVQEIKQKQQEARVPTFVNSGPQIIANSSQVRNSLDSQAINKINAAVQQASSVQQPGHPSVAPSLPPRPSSANPVAPPRPHRPERRDPPSVLYDAYNSSCKQAYFPRHLGAGDFLNSSSIKLTFKAVQDNNSTLVFEVEQNQTSPDFRLKRVILPLHLQLGAYLHPNDVRMVGKPAGHYVSKPVMHNPSGNTYKEMYLVNYTQFQNGTITKNNLTHGGVMNFYFGLKADVRNQECMES